MWSRLLAVAALVALVGAGAALVARAERPTPLQSGPGEPSRDGSPVSTISRGETVALEDHVDPSGGFTIFEFYADW